MSYSIIPTPNFETELKRLSKKYPSLKSEITALGASLKELPFQGVLIFKNCYKIRVSVKSKGQGKSGGARLITYVKVQNERVYLLSIYDKSEKTTVSDKNLQHLLRDLP